jgi:tryptophan synthase alpha chain
VTGARDALAPGTRDLVARIRRETALPVALGFGISRPEHVVEAGRSADAAVVGSGLVGVIAATEDPRALASRVDSYVRWLKGETEVLTA